MTLYSCHGRLPYCQPNPSLSLSDWCKAHDLSTIETKLREQEGIIRVSELQQLCIEDVNQIMVDCKMNRGEKIRFANAMKQLLQVARATPPKPSNQVSLATKDFSDASSPPHPNQKTNSLFYELLWSTNTNTS